MNTIKLSDIIASLSKPDASIYTCENICDFLRNPDKLHQITPQLHAKLHALVPEMINCNLERKIMDDWLNYEFFSESKIPEVQEMKKFLKLKSRGYWMNSINFDVEFKIALFSYLMKQFGDLEWSFVFDQV